MNKDLRSRVGRFVAHYCAVDIERIRDSTTLFADLGIDGDDAVDFFEAFRDEFGVDLSSLELSRQFGPEGLPFWLPLLPFVSFVKVVLRRRRKPMGLVPISVADLFDAVVCGKLEIGIPDELVLVVVEDGTLELVESKHQATQYYEGIDVESGVFRFYDAAGRYLEPCFTTPNRSGRLFGILPWALSGKFDLLPSQAAPEDDVWVCLAETNNLELNPWFNSVEEIREYVLGNSE